ncbi:hypothetical protein LguiB_028589 [Lonicera macranthoides]
MKSRRGKRSEAFWPSIVMKKWLNIKPNVYEFSEDEVGSETESEDDTYSLKDEQIHQGDNPARRTQGNLVTLGTWNVAGRPPYDDLEIDEWLCMKEPADIYVLGFQEVVPLNAANVLGAETRRPITKWEAIIRKTLNGSFEPETKHKSYSAPPSPVLRTSSAADILADAVDTPSLEIIGSRSTSPNYTSDPESQKPVMDAGKDFQLRRIYGIDSDSRLDWPEQSLDTASQVLPSTFKLRRVSSSSARVGSNLMENSLIFNSGLEGVHNSSANLGLMGLDEENRHEVLDSLSDVSDQFSEEEVDCFEDISELQDENVILDDGVKLRPRYVRIVSKQMVGLYVSVWIRRRLRRHVNNLEVSPVGVGLMGYMGNKGSVSISMSVYQTRLCFVCSHLTSGEKEGDEQRRNADVYEILRRTCFSSDLDTAQPLTIQSHDQIFWFGDLNYRINMLDTEVRKLAAQKQWDELRNFDQLTNEMRTGHVFEGWKEGIIDFAPTYKYEINSDRYVGENFREGEKKRSPAWCDRILWLGKGIRQLSYERCEVQLSDHRPISSVFSVEVEIFNHRKLQRALNATNAAVHPELYLDEEDLQL